MRELEGQVALVTGGSRGIGLAVSRALAEAGARVAVVGRDGDRAREVAGSLPGGGHGGYSLNVADGEAVREVVPRIVDEVGNVTILVNNAGVTRDGVLVRLKDEDWDLVLDVNLRGAFHMTRALLRGMMRRRAGAIVNVTSVVGLTGNPGQANYAAAKAGLVGFTKSVAREVASRGIRVNAVAPGFIETGMTAPLGDRRVAELAGRIPMGRLGTPEDVAGVVRFLVGPWARYITGQIIVVDGGMVI